MILWFPGSRPARVGGKTKWMGVLVEVEVEVGEGFRGWDHREGGSRKWIPMGPGGNLAVMVDLAVTKILSLGLEVWVKAAQVGVDTRAVDVMGGMEGAGMEVLGGRTIVIATAITMEEVMTVEGEEGIIEVGVAIVHVGEVAVEVGVVVEAVAGDTELSFVHTFLNSTVLVLEFRTYSSIVQRKIKPAQLQLVPR